MTARVYVNLPEGKSWKSTWQCKTSVTQAYFAGKNPDPGSPLLTIWKLKVGWLHIIYMAIFPTYQTTETDISHTWHEVCQCYIYIYITTLYNILIISIVISMFAPSFGHIISPSLLLRHIEQGQRSNIILNCTSSAAKTLGWDAKENCDMIWLCRQCQTLVWPVCLAQCGVPCYHIMNTHNNSGLDICGVRAFGSTISYTHMDLTCMDFVLQSVWALAVAEHVTQVWHKCDQVCA